MIPLPPLINTSLSGRGVRQHEVALRVAEVDDHAGGTPVAEVSRDQAVGVRRHGQLEQAAVVRRARGRVRPGAANAVDLDSDAYELARAEPAPRPVRAERQRHAPFGLAADGDHLGARVADRQLGPDQLEVAVDPVRADEQVDDGGSKDSAGAGHGRHGMM